MAPVSKSAPSNAPTPASFRLRSGHLDSEYERGWQPGEELKHWKFALTAYGAFLEQIVAIGRHVTAKRPIAQLGSANHVAAQTGEVRRRSAPLLDQVEQVQHHPDTVRASAFTIHQRLVERRDRRKWGESDDQGKIHAAAQVIHQSGRR